jgi:nitrogen fixation NifU-like protein
VPGLEDLYREIILDHYKNQRNSVKKLGELPVPPAHFVEGYNPLCGDDIKVFVLVEHGVVQDIRIDGHGCSISQSSASMMSTAVKGKPVDEARATIGAFKRMLSVGEDEADEPAPEVKLGDLEALQGVTKFPTRIKCATLAWNTLAQGLDETG